MLSASWFMCGTAGVLAMISKSGIEKLRHSLLNELEKLWESVWFIFGVSKKLSWNMVGVFSIIFSAKASTISLLTWKESLFRLSLSTLQDIFFSKVLHTSSFNKLFVYTVNAVRLFWFFSLLIIVIMLAFNVLSSFVYTLLLTVATFL